jgi:hypothetical protein
MPSPTASSSTSPPASGFRHKPGRNQPQIAATPNAAGWQKYVGFYAYPGHKGIDITIERGKLVITSRLSGNTYRYLPEGENLWRGQGGRVAGELLRFDTDAAGEVLRADMGNEVFERQALSPLPLRERPGEG